jgi:tight adherence protein C
MSLILGAAWLAAILAVAVAWRPAPARVRALRATAAPSARGGVRWARWIAAAFTVPGLLLAPPLVAAAALWWWLKPRLGQRRRARARDAAVTDTLPDVADLLLLATGAGLTLPLALPVVARRGPHPVAGALDTVLQATARGARVADALAELPAVAGERIRPLASVLIDHERYGTPLGPALERVILELRLDRRRRAEQAARRVPVQLLFPLVSCTLPAFALLTVVPLLAGSLGALRL